MKELQSLLAAYGYGAPYTGVFDQETRKAVISFQKTNKLKADGVVRTEMWNKMT